MNNDKKKLFEAFEKICGIKLLNEQEIVIGEVERIKNWLIDKLYIPLDIDEDGINSFNDVSFDFKINNKEYFGLISLDVDATIDIEKGDYDLPDMSDTNINEIDIKKLIISDGDTNIIVFDEQNQNHIDLIKKLENTIEVK